MQGSTSFCRAIDGLTFDFWVLNRYATADGHALCSVRRGIRVVNDFPPTQEA
jgi:hypothetical protein